MIFVLVFHDVTKHAFLQALIGNPKVLFLDEPSTGMDATAKRQMWDLINKVSVQRSVVITTHSMEECEAICTRIGIMVGGKLKCLGSSQHLKHKFGASYEINIRCPEVTREKCLLRLQKEFENVMIEEQHHTYFRLKVDHGVDLSSAFGILEAMKANQDIFEYSMSQSTLEQIFINFAREQQDAEDSKLAKMRYTGDQSTLGKGKVEIEMSERAANPK
mmetsp:Transcript_34717/g.64808  ORF Transcript_34717/g.64808 Transcript_34717/m.64808 type:complete len:218 (+) Transcript_34717:4323-4976(+)